MFVLVHCHVVDGAVVDAQTTLMQRLEYRGTGVFDNPAVDLTPSPMSRAVDAWPVADKDVAYLAASLAYVVSELREFLVGFALIWLLFRVYPRP